MILPSGEQYQIRHGAQVAVITEVGAGLRSYTVAGREVLDGYGPGEMCGGARGQALIPWPNRIRAARYTWQGTPLQLDLTEPEKGGAIHGLTRWAPWRLAGQQENRAALRYVLHACPGWPFVLGSQLGYALSDGGLTVATTVTNLGETACPYGTGAHPYLSAGTPVIDPARVQVPGAAYLPVDEAGIPAGCKPVDGTRYDLREEQELGDRQIDVAYTDLRRDSDGRARVRLTGPGGPAVALWVDESYPYLEIFTGDALPETRKRRTGLGVEPMTCVPDAFNSGTGLITLQPGETHSAAWGIEPGR